MLQNTLSECAYPSTVGRDRDGGRWRGAGCYAFHSLCIAIGGTNERMTPAGGSTFSVPARGLQLLCLVLLVLQCNSNRISLLHEGKKVQPFQ